MKIAIIGAGSQVFGRRSVVDVMAEPLLNNAETEVVLVDTDREKLSGMYKLVVMLKDYLKSPVHITQTPDRKDALRGADYIFISVSARRYELWEQDFRVPFAYGFKQAYGENGGPGALFHALRNIHLIMRICADIQEYCPKAVLINFSNPESRVLLAIKMLTDIQAIGLCHGQNDALKAVSALLGKPEEEIETRGGGINHFFWLYEIRDRITGEDLYPQVREATRTSTDPNFTLPKKLLEIYGMLTYPDNTHAGEFVAFGAEYMHNKWVHGLESRKAGRPHKSMIDINGPFLRREKPLDEIAVKSREIGVPIITAHSHDRRAFFNSGNVLNDGLFIPNLLPDGIVEVPIEVDANGFHPQKLPPLPDGPAALSRTQMAIQKLTVMAYQQRSKNLLLQTLLLEPAVDSITRAEALIDDMLELQAEYLPVFQ